jgi:hypothetical protein
MSRKLKTVVCYKQASGLATGSSAKLSGKNSSHLLEKKAVLKGSLRIQSPLK